MKATQKIQVIHEGISIYTQKNKVFSVFDYFTAQAVTFALKAIEDTHRKGEECLSICGEFGDKLTRNIQVRLV
jgi:hypothetical protein